MIRKHAEDDAAQRNSKLQAVFGKLSGVLPKPPDLGSPKTMSSDIIESVFADAPLPTTTSGDLEANAVDTDRGLCTSTARLSRRLEMALRAAKRTHLSCGEVLIPCGLLHRISNDVFAMAESELCGIRGCLIYVNFETQHECRRLFSIKCDPETATTFELNLTFKQNPTGWNFIPQFLKNLTRGGTIVVSPSYALSKKKLYRSELD